MDAVKIVMEREGRPTFLLALQSPPAEKNAQILRKLLDPVNARVAASPDDSIENVQRSQAIHTASLKTSKISQLHGSKTKGSFLEGKHTICTLS